MSTAQALLVFVATPLAIIGLIIGLVFAIAGRDENSPPSGPPAGIAPERNPCDVRAQAGGHVIHEPASTDTDRRTCWTLACAECGTPYQEGPHDVHFANAWQAITVARYRGWMLTGHRMRCPRCA